MPRKLKASAIDRINTDPVLYGRICESLEVKPFSLPQILSRNSHRLTNYDIVMIVAGAMEVEPDDVLEDIEEPAPLPAA